MAKSSTSEKRKKEAKRGSVTIYVMVFMTSLVMMLSAFIRASFMTAAGSTARTMAGLRSASILSEYDICLKDRYDIFGYYGPQSEVNRKLSFYASKGLSGVKGIEKFKISGSPSDFSLRNVEEFKKQVVVSGKMDAVRKAGKVKDSGKEKDGQDYKHTFFPTKSDTDLYRDLPSESASSGLSASGTAKFLESDNGVVDKTSNRYFEQRYIFSRFKDASDDHGIGKTYLQYEVEYLIAGKHGDKADKLSVKLKILAVREIFNMMFILQDEKMNAETLAAAELITPGPAAPLTQKAIQAAWAAAESENDYRLLVSGKKVPVFKDSVSWALDLDSILTASSVKAGGAGNEEKSGEKTPDDDPDQIVKDRMKKDIPFVDPGNKKGLKYSQYLKAMLLTMDENTLLLRMMDLIQMNMRYHFYSDFRISDYCAGINTMIDVNGKRYTVTRMYQPTSDLLGFHA